MQQFATNLKQNEVEVHDVYDSNTETIESNLNIHGNNLDKYVLTAENYNEKIITIDNMNNDSLNLHYNQDAKTYAIKFNDKTQLYSQCHSKK